MLKSDADAVKNAIIPNDLIYDVVVFVEGKGSFYSIPPDSTSAERQRCIEKFRDLFVSLIDAGADINAIGLHQQTALGTTRLNSVQFPELVNFLIEMGAVN